MIKASLETAATSKQNCENVTVVFKMQLPHPTLCASDFKVSNKLFGLIIYKLKTHINNES